MGEILIAGLASLLISIFLGPKYIHDSRLERLSKRRRFNVTNSLLVRRLLRADSHLFLHWWPSLALILTAKVRSGRSQRAYGVTESG